MTTSFPELTDPREAFLEAGYQPVVPSKKQDSPHLLLIGMGIGAAILGIKMIMSHQLAKKNPQSPEEARGLAMSIWEANRSVWRKLATPSVLDAYKLGGPSLFIPGDKLEKLAVIYVDELGDYFHQTSVDALVEGFSAQLNSGWSNDISWRRSTPAYGLDSKQTRSYVITLTEQAKGKYDPQPIPEKSAAAIDKLMLDRADRIGSNEAYKATQMGRNTVWLYMEKHGDIHGAKKRWITAHDELVCSVCASLDRQEKDLSDPFETPTGEKIHAPGAHPNCRCEIVLNLGMNIVKNLPGDPFDRDRRGRFSSTEQRQANKIETRRPPIGSQYVPIGSSYAPIGSTSGPIGSARAPIGESLPPIGSAFLPVGTELPPIGAPPAKAKTETKPEQPKIGQGKTKIKNPLPNKVKATTKTATTSTVSNQLSTTVDSPIETDIGNKSGIKQGTKINLHKSPLIIPASEYIKESGLNINRFIKPDKNNPNPVIEFEGGYIGYVGDIKNEHDSEAAILEAFDHEMSTFVPKVKVAEMEIDEATPSRKPQQRDSRVIGQATAAMDHKAPLVFFVVKDGWTGLSMEGLTSEELSVGLINGSFEIVSDEIVHMNADMRTNAYPTVVRDYIESGSGPKTFTDMSNASDLVSGIIYIPIRSAPDFDRSRVIKHAPRLLLRRK
jgi:hypothetical protein